MAVTSTANHLETLLSAAYRTAEELSEAIALTGEARAKIGELYEKLRSELQPIAGKVEEFRDSYLPDNRQHSPDATLLATMVAGYMGMQVAALGMLNGALIVVTYAEGADFDYVTQVIQDSTAVFRTHRSMVTSTLRAPALSLVEIARLYTSDPSGAFAVFMNEIATFPEVRARLLPSSPV